MSNSSSNTLYDFSAKDIDGNRVDLNRYKGQLLLIVNVASYCGYTRNNYKQLNELYDRYAQRNFNVLAFPCNQFNNEEPACEADIKLFADKNNVNFDLFAKIDVNGLNEDPIYKWLKSQCSSNSGDVQWNFEKFLINRDGRVSKRYAPDVEPNNIEPDLKKLI